MRLLVWCLVLVFKETGLLFDSPCQFVDQAQRLLSDGACPCLVLCVQGWSASHLLVRALAPALIPLLVLIAVSSVSLCLSCAASLVDRLITKAKTYVQS